MLTLLRAVAAIAIALEVFGADITSAEPLLIEVDFARTNGAIRPLHGINKGPLVAGGLIDLTGAQHAMGIPYVRLHDCHWPNPDVVDIHALFPNPASDPMLPESYDFALTDEYIAAIQKTGAKIIYRLGESIEHTAHKRFVHPPKDPDKWAAVCIGIIRHYNEGWAGGFHFGIPYWEIWNEPENRPAMWSGTDEQYLALYKSAALAIKKHDPNLKVGGPAVGYSGRFENRTFHASAFVSAFLEHCHRESLPLDFFSWHCYAADPTDLVARAKAIRQLLDARGFAQTESHLNEWNYLPGNSWQPVSKSATPELRQKSYEEMSGAAGAAFIASALISLQDAPVKMCNLFHGEAGEFGLFNEQGVPSKNYWAMRALHEVTKTGPRVVVSSITPSKIDTLAALSLDSSEAVLVLSNFRSEEERVTLKLSNLPWKNATKCEFAVLNNRADWRTNLVQIEGDELRLQMSRPSVGMLKLRPR